MTRKRKQSKAEDAGKLVSFKVGPFVYDVSVSKGKIMQDGVEKLGVVLERHHQLLISEDAPLFQRLPLVAELVVRAHGLHFGCDNSPSAVAAMLVSMLHDLERVGGEPALIALQP